MRRVRVIDGWRYGNWQSARERERERERESVRERVCERESIAPAKGTITHICTHINIQPKHTITNTLGP